MKVYLSPSTQDWNEYAGGGNEEFWMRRICFPLADMLRAAGHEVKVGGTVSAKANALDGNAWGPDYYVAVHSNAGGGHGSEVWHYPGSAKGEALAKAVYAKVAAVSKEADRGVKASSGYIELNTPKAPAIIVETAFHDNPTEAAEIRDDPLKFARAIAQGILEVVGGGIPAEVQPDTSWGAVVIHGGNNTDLSHYVNDAKSRGDAVAWRLVPKDSYKDIEKMADAAAAAVSH